MSKPLLHFENTIEEEMTPDNPEATFVKLELKISVRCEGLDHAAKLCKTITSAVDRAVTPEHLAERGI